jgi:predicted RNA-binding Zn-ribbon protein involved in translation (DUF1610 family)
MTANAWDLGSIIEVCNHCGRSVSQGSGSFVNRVPDCNDIQTRRANGLRHPYGDFVCADCDSGTSDGDYFPAASLN